ncbi:retrovirus-related pol polyprotein from transposon TNT 1-94 [Tanacetum coccineum]
MHPPGPLLSWARLATHDVQIGKFFVPAGTTAMVNMWAITHDPSIWKNPWDFKPERFIEEEVPVMVSNEGLAKCKASATNIRRIQVRDIVKEVKDYLKTYSSAGMDIRCWKDRFLIYLDGLEPHLLEASSSKALISNTHLQDNDSDVKKDTRSSSKFQADSNDEFHDRALLANQNRFYKRSRRVRSAKKPMDESNETLSSKDEGITKVKVFMAIVKDELSVGKANARSSQWVEITMKKADESPSQTAPEITSDFESECDYQDPLPPLPKLSGVEPNDSGCFRHMTGVKQYLHRYSKESGPKVVFGDNSSGDTEGYGLVNYNGITFTRVAYMNGLKHNLISISHLCDANFIVLFTKTSGTTFNQNNEVVLISSRRKDVYVIDMSSYNEEKKPVFLPKPPIVSTGFGTRDYLMTSNNVYFIASFIPCLRMSWMNDGYCNGGNLPGTFIIENQLHYQDYEWYEALEDSELKDEALRNKAIMEGFIKDDDDESNYEQMRRWDIYTNYDDTYKTNHDDNEREELCEVHEPPVCTIQRFEMIKYSFGQGEEYVAIKEDEYDDLAGTSNNACRPREGNIDEYWWRIYESGNLEVLES